MKYLGIDWGLKRVGLAISEGELASPLGTLVVAGLRDGVGRVVDVVRREDIEVVIIGKPEGEMGDLVEGVLKHLLAAGINALTADETFSTQSAKRELLKMGKGKKARRDDNAVAAAIILQRYLDEKP